MEILYLLLIAPLENIMRFIMDQSYNITHSYGISIIILSIFVNILLLPLYHMAEKWQQDERSIQSRMKEYNDFIKQSFKKQERYAMLNEMYRIFKYHPIMALRTSFGLLIQIPFFFSAYHLLSHYTAMDGVSFGLFSNLFKADQLITIGTIHINIMPFVMTIINLVSAYVYTKNLQKKDKIQLWILALIFLALLYSSPVGLVLYWTLNNIFSFLKNIVYKLVEKTSVMGKYFTSPKIYRDVLDKLYISLFFTNIFILLMSLATFAINLQTFEHPFKTDDSVNALLPSVLLLSSSLVLYYVLSAVNLFKTKALTIDHIKTHKKIAFIALLSVVLLIICNVNYIKIFITHKEKTCIFVRNNFIMLIITYVINSRYLYNLIAIRLKNMLKHNYNSMFYGLLISFAIYIGCYLPISFIKGDTNLFNLTPQELIHILLPVSSVIAIAIMYVNHFIVNKIFKNSTIFLILTLLVLLCFSFINMDYGVLTSTFFTKAKGLYNNHNIAFDFILIFAIITVFLFIVSSKLYHYIKFLPIMFLLLIVGITTYNYNDMKKVFIFNNTTDKSKHLSYSNNTLNFSKTKKNIVVLILDAFDGRYIQGMINDKLPAINEFSGFTWYSNALSAANSTYQGYGSILGGFKYTPEYIEHHHYSIMQGYQDLYKKMLAFYQANDFETSLVHPQWYTQFFKYPDTSHCENDPLVDHCISDYKTEANYIDLLHKNYFKNEHLTITYPKADHMLSLKMSIFRILPLFSKQFMYDKGRWMNQSTNNIMPSKMQFVASMPYISTTTAKTKTFKVIHSIIAHGPFQLNPNTCLRNTDNTVLHTPYARLLKPLGLTVMKNYGDDVCTIKFVANFIRWLKSNNVYDNTKIVLVSEHDYTTNPQKVKVLKSIKITDYPGIRPYFLLMVKDFSAKNKSLVVDTKHFVSTYDTPAILCNGIKDCQKEYGENFTKKIVKNRTIITSDTPWQPADNYANHYKIYAQVKVTNSIFNVDNYTRVK